ncbi:hypothetical protein ACERK3_14180, partial [Phycisphaerales bacterium AB-hyl4]
MAQRTITQPSHVSVQTLTRREQAERQRLEDVIATAATWAKLEAESLLTIRERKLYRSTHKSFGAYAYDVWSMSRAHANRLCAWAEVINNVSPIGDTYPQREWHARPLYGLTPGQQRQAWRAYTSRSKAGIGALVAACNQVRCRMHRKQDHQARATRLDNARVICADVLDGLEQVEDGSVGLV